jgi:hypothetical protein
MPEQARAVAKDLGLPYYETSVLTYFGVNQVSLSCVAKSVFIFEIKHEITKLFQNILFASTWILLVLK